MTTHDGRTCSREIYGREEHDGRVDWNTNMSAEINDFAKMLNDHLAVLGVPHEYVWRFVTLGNTIMQEVRSICCNVM